MLSARRGVLDALSGAGRTRLSTGPTRRGAATGTVTAATTPAAVLGFVERAYRLHTQRELRSDQGRSSEISPWVAGRVQGRCSGGRGVEERALAFGVEKSALSSLVVVSRLDAPTPLGPQDAS